MNRVKVYKPSFQWRKENIPGGGTRNVEVIVNLKHELIGEKSVSDSTFMQFQVDEENTDRSKAKIENAVFRHRIYMEADTEFKPKETKGKKAAAKGGKKAAAKTETSNEEKTKD